MNEKKINMEKQLSGYEIHRLTADMKIITNHSSEYFHENKICCCCVFFFLKADWMHVETVLVLPLFR